MTKHDAYCGNPLSYYNGSSYTFTWENGRQLSTAVKDGTTLSFDYNDEGIRRTKVVDGIPHTYYVSGSQIIAEEWGQNGVIYLYIYLYDAEGSPIGMQYRKSSMSAGTFYTYWFEKNLRGDIVAVYNESGTKLISYYYDAWGRIIQTNYHNTSGNNSYATHNPFRYRGYYYDTETGLYYLNSRYYDPVTGRFISADGHVNANGDIIGFNMFAYCSNNPINKIDSTGREAITLTLFLTGSLLLLTVALLTHATVEVSNAISNTPLDLPSKSSSKLFDKDIKKQNDSHPGKYTFYFLADEEGDIRYVGRTKNLAKRLNTHKNFMDKNGLKLDFCLSELTWSEARGLEQWGINTFHTIDNGLNSINGIAASNPNLPAYAIAAWDYVYNVTTNDLYNILGT